MTTDTVTQWVQRVRLLMQWMLLSKHWIRSIYQARYKCNSVVRWKRRS
jgi:hypothetical protein